MTSTTSLQLTQEEQALFQFLRDTTEAAGTLTVMRVAGGWVRDKLMGLPADDIDISLDNMTGAEFGTLIKTALAEQDGGQPEPKKQKVGPSKVAVISIRPELGKFVETATVHCLGFSLDLLSLRSQVQLGEKQRQSGSVEELLLTEAAEDAHLRDFTVNALFYNINSGEVEDFVGGLQDLRKGLVRCPNAFDRKYFAAEGCCDPARERDGTLLRIQEDPLRCLRAIRFSAKFEFALSPAIEEIARSPNVQRFLLENTTSERILTETKKIFSLSPVSKALRGLRDIVGLGLLGSVFPMAYEISEQFWLLHDTLCERCAERVMQKAAPLQTEQSLLLLAAFFTPLFATEGHTYGNGATHQFPLTREHMKETWKYPVKHAAEVLELMEAAVFLQAARALPWGEDTQRQTGRWLRKTKGKWVHALLIAREWTALVDGDSSTRQFDELEQHIHEAGLDGRYGSAAWNMPMHYTGKEMVKELGVTPGPGMGALIDQLVDWQLLHMNGTKEEARAFLLPLIAAAPPQSRPARRK